MTGLVLLCILPAGQPPGMDIAPPDGAPLQGYLTRTLTLWTRPAPHPPTATLEGVRAHHAVVEAAWRSVPAVLPVRFGQWFATPAELIAAVAAKEETYGVALERIRGTGEFSVRILDPDLEESAQPAHGGPASGTEYLRAAAERARARAVVEARGRAVAAQLRSALGDLVRDERVEPLPSPHGLATVAHLVRRADEAEYAAGVGRFVQEAPGVRLLRTGPWPPWSFSA